MRVYLKLHLLLTLAAVACLAQPPVNRFDNPEGRAQGAVLFQINCAYCHGVRGEGGRGADLTTGVYRHGGSDRELFSNIRNGIPGTEMPALRGTDDEAWKMAAFIKTFNGSGTAEKASGDAAAGRAVFSGKGNCTACHSIGGEGGTVGPDLAGIGRRRGLPHLMESLVSPEADVPNAFRAVQLTTTTGQNVGGIRLNEDDVSIQLRDTDGNLRSFFKDNLKEIRRNKPSLMPAYGSMLNKAELDNLVAYLSSLRSAQ
jgi:putative heme-binding domain-containing protein